jgi:energy-coupling factor transporter ATP-binding protein EcfA2
VLLCPEDRKKEGIIPLSSVAENINISARGAHSRFGWLLRDGWEKGNAEQQIKAMKVKTPNAEQKILYLSGGNQQKAILGRWLSMPMKVLLLDEPTRGIDIGAKAEIYQIIHNLAASGIAVIVVSSDLMEVMGISDRILVLCEGAMRGEQTRAHATESNLLQLAAARPGELRDDHDHSTQAAGDGRKPRACAAGQLGDAAGGAGDFSAVRLADRQLPLAAEHARAGPGDFHRGHRRLHHVVLPGVRALRLVGGLGDRLRRGGGGDRDARHRQRPAGVGAALLMGLIVGLINGIVIAKLRVNALITTLATMQIVRGLAYIFADGKAVGCPRNSSSSSATASCWACRCRS